MTFRARLGRPGVDSQKIKIGSTSNDPVTAVVSHGSVSVGSWSEAIAPTQSTLGVYTGVVTVTGLPGFSEITCVVTQGSVSRTLTWTTLPADQDTPFSFVFSSCDKWFPRHGGGGIWGAMREFLAESDAPPALFLVFPDDVSYVDEAEHNDPVLTGLVSSGKPQDTGELDDYHIAWAAEMGVLGIGKHRGDDYQWAATHLPAIKTGGDHMVSKNYCRGRTGASDYSGCDPVLGATAKAAWNAWYGDVNPDPLRAGTLYFGLEAGPLRLVMLDSQYHSTPYDGTNALESRATHHHFGADQLSDMFGYLDTDTVPFKTMCIETGFDNAGQPWVDWWTDEATNWHTELGNRVNLNGIAGNFFGLCGDNHVQAVDQHDIFWSFINALADTTVVGSWPDKNPYGWAWLHTPGIGNRRFFRGRGAGEPIGGRALLGWLHCIVHANESPKRIQMVGYDGANKSKVFSYSLTAGSANNQWVPDVDASARKVAV